MNIKFEDSFDQNRIADIYGPLGFDELQQLAILERDESQSPGVRLLAKAVNRLILEAARSAGKGE